MAKYHSEAASTSSTNIGYKCDLIVRETVADHENSDEYGVGETATNTLNAKTIKEKGLKLPKVMKDMLDKLIISNYNIIRK